MGRELRIDQRMLKFSIVSAKCVAEPKVARVAGRGARPWRDSGLRTISSIPCVMLIVLTFVKSLSWEDEMW